MEFKYGFDFNSDAIYTNLRRITNQTYKLLPTREEGGNWERALETILEELSGMDRLFLDQQPVLFKLSCKLEGLFVLTEKDDFALFRAVIFECLNLLSQLQKICQDQI